MDSLTDVRLRRTALTTPAADRAMLGKAADSGADEVVADLEDSVVPDRKAAARESLVEALREEDWTGTVASARVNGVATRWWHEDVTELVRAAGPHLDCVVVPKVQTAGDVHAVDRLLAAVETDAGLEVGSVGLAVQIEDAVGLTNAAAIAGAADRLEALAFGPGDYAASVGARGLSVGGAPEYPGHYWQYPLSRLVRAGAAAGLQVVDGPYADFEDEAGLREAAQRAAALGCNGKWVVHPAQIAPVNETFSPTREDAQRARRIVDAYADTRAAGSGVVRVDGEMVDEATRRLAERVLAAAEAAGVLGDEE
jgi:citrate lyase subunit beta/citryl-CoA lyase